MHYDEAFHIVHWLVGRLQPFCGRIEIAGSVRRQKAEVHDIEILAIPNLTALPKPKLEFGKPVPIEDKTMLDKWVREMREAGNIILEKSGDRYKKFFLKKDRIWVDLFLVLPPAQWGVQFVIRTGPADFSHWIVTRRRLGGRLPNGFRVQNGAVWQGEIAEKNPDPRTILSMPEEADFFKFLELEWIEPGNRVARWR